MKILILIVSTLLSSTVLAQQTDTAATILIDDSTITRYKSVDMDKYSDSTLVLLAATAELDKIAEKKKWIRTTDLFMITKSGDYLYNYHELLSPVTELSFYYKLLEHGYLTDSISALEWQQLSIKKQKKKLKKYNHAKSREKALPLIN